MRHINLDKYADQYLTLDCFVCKKILKLFILAVLEFKIFLKKLKNLLGIKTLKQTYLEYKQTIK